MVLILTRTGCVLKTRDEVVTNERTFSMIIFTLHTVFLIQGLWLFFSLKNKHIFEAKLDKDK